MCSLKKDTTFHQGFLYSYKFKNELKKKTCEQKSNSILYKEEKDACEGESSTVMKER